MKTLLGYLGFVLILGGGTGLLADRLGGFRLFGFVRYLVPDGHETVGYAALLALGVLLSIPAARRG
ncbi:hypothetical protein [Streptomyces rubellomurinus]|uniref:Uncharacterized protein n=2 Tax=Streptomyces TaxID=1883 RepID=A0A0F2TPU2_STRR3|nr:hypothetical protein [Streptomyces rubellomurinus]KJS63742.1 hypothetical protein VM95_00255 [Streptomyces rubellomurinus]